jgi:hypothetical protein
MPKPTEAKKIKKPETEEAELNGQQQDETHQLSQDDSATVRSAEMALMEAHRQLGVAREQYLIAEAKAAQGINDARQKYQGLVQTLAQKLGIDLTKGSWTFNQQTMTFTKVPQVQ